jgi:3-oxoadipate enol-lactonase
VNDLPFYIERGSGETAVFLLHGVGGGHRAFDATLPSLAQAGYRAIAWDAPGYGASAAKEPLSMAVFADALLQLVNHIGAKRSVVVGHSMGGMIAQEACVRQPGRLDGLVLFATSAAFGKPGGDWQKEFLQSRFAALDAGLGMAGLAPVLVGGMLALGASQETRIAATTLMCTVTEATYRAALAAIVSFNRLENLPHINAPALCLACDEDKTAPPSVMQKMAEKMPHATFQSLAHAGHLGNMEQPRAFNAAVLGFLRQHFPLKG